MFEPSEIAELPSAIGDGAEGHCIVCGGFASLDAGQHHSATEVANVDIPPLQSSEGVSCGLTETERLMLACVQRSAPEYASIQKASYTECFSNAGVGVLSGGPAVCRSSAGDGLSPSSESCNGHSWLDRSRGRLRAQELDWAVFRSLAESMSPTEEYGSEKCIREAIGRDEVQRQVLSKLLPI